MVEEIVIGDPMDNLAGHNVQAANGAGNMHQQLAQEQASLRYAFCGKLKECGHTCKGVEGEAECFPCPNVVCIEDRNNPRNELQPQDMIDMPPQPQLERKATELINATEEDFCGLCHVTSLTQMPCVVLKCRHVYHADCVYKRLSTRSKQRRINVDYLACPVCKQDIALKESQAPIELLQILEDCLGDKEQKVKEAEKICRSEGLDKRGKVATEGDPYYNQPAKFMFDQTTLYNCNDCRKVYFGGMNDYEGALRENMDPENFLCQVCAEKALGYGKEICEAHGNEFTDFKCQMCCSIALYVFEGGKKFRCQPCFNDHMEKNGHERVKSDCHGGKDCSLGISNHPPAPQKYPLGCSLCRSEKLEIIVKETKAAGFNLEKRDDMMKKHGNINNQHEQNAYIVRGQHTKRHIVNPARQVGSNHEKCCTIF